MGWFPEKKLPAQWKDLLASENTPVTLEEYQAGTMIRLMGQIVEAAQALRHLEGMVGAIDEAFSRHDPDYAGSAAIREALDTHRRALSDLTDNNPALSEAVRRAVQSASAIAAPRDRPVSVS